jgi:hypothetical protein
MMDYAHMETQLNGCIPEYKEKKHTRFFIENRLKYLDDLIWAIN